MFLGHAVQELLPGPVYPGAHWQLFEEILPRSLVEPAGHAVHWVTPGCPVHRALHRQAEILVAASMSDVNCAGQSMQPIEPTDDLYLPSAHAEQGPVPMYPALHAH